MNKSITIKYIYSDIRLSPNFDECHTLQYICSVHMLVRDFVRLQPVYATSIYVQYLCWSLVRDYVRLQPGPLGRRISFSCHESETAVILTQT